MEDMVEQAGEGSSAGWAGRLPARLPQQTFPEARAAAMALAAGPVLGRWTPLPGASAFTHAVPGQPLQVRLDRPAGWEAARLPAALRESGLGAVLLLHIALGAILTTAGPVTLEIDALLRAAGRHPHSREQRAAQRQRLRAELQLIGALAIFGRRRGAYRDRHSRAPLDLAIGEPLLVALTPPDDPERVTLAAGPWLARFQGNHAVLTTFGDVRRLVALPGGQAGGAWAQSLGLALQQRWREQVTRAQRRTARDGSPTLRFRPFSRRELLTLFPPDPSVDAILAGEHPQRARRYWDEAIGLLQAHSLLVGRPRPVRSLRSPATPSRKGWEDAWLEEAFEFTPAEADAAALVEMAGSRHGRPAAW